jgi:ribosomal protein S6
MSLFIWGEKRFAKGIAKAMKRSYNMYKVSVSGAKEHELVKMTPSDRPGSAITPESTLY